MTAVAPSAEYASLSAPARRRVDEIKDCRQTMLRLERTLATERYAQEWRVARALDDGVPASVLADTLGVSTSRIYQIRAECRRRETA